MIPNGPVEIVTGAIGVVAFYACMVFVVYVFRAIGRILKDGKW